MTRALAVRLEREVQAALDWREGADPTALWCALGQVLALRALDHEALLPPQLAKRLQRVAARALLSDARSDPEAGDGRTDAAVTTQLQTIARGGLAVLRGEPSPKRPLHALHPPARTLTRMLVGEIDGLTAGRYAAHMVACKRCQREVELLRDVTLSSADAQPMSLAAADTPSVRPPEGGRVIATREDPALEAVLFEDDGERRLAIYALQLVPVQVVAEGLTTEETLAGYYMGRVEPGLSSLDLHVRIGDGDGTDWRVQLEAEG